MKRLVLMLSFLAGFSGMVILAQTAGEPFATEDEAKAALDRAQNQIRSGDQCADGVWKRNEKNNQDWQKANNEISKIISERNKVVAEMRAGLYCDQCWNSKTQIEKGKEDFYAHLKRVRGQQVAAPASKINEKINEYARQVKNVEQRIEGFRNNFNQNQKDYQGCQNLRAYGFNEASTARYWVTTLRYRAEQEKRRKAIEEAARQLRAKIEAENERRRTLYEAMLERQRQMLEAKKKAMANLQDRLQSFRENLASMFKSQSTPDYITPDSEDTSTINRGYFGDDRYGLDDDSNTNKSFLTRMFGKVDTAIKGWRTGKDVYEGYNAFYGEGTEQELDDRKSNFVKDKIQRALENVTFGIVGKEFSRGFAGTDYDNPEVRDNLEQIGLDRLPKTWYKEVKNFNTWTRLKQSFERIKTIPKYVDSKYQMLEELIDKFWEDLYNGN